MGSLARAFRTEYISMPTGIPPAAAFASVARIPNGASAAVAVKLRLDQRWRFIFLCSLAGSLLQVGGVVAEVRRAAEWLGVRYVIDARGRVRKNTWTMAQKLSDKRLAVLGAGKLGGILLRAYLKQGLFAAKRVTATVKHAEKATALAKELGVSVTNENRRAVKDADIVLLGVKPQVVGEVLKEIAAELSEKTLVISVAASVPTSYIEQHAGSKVPVIRAMPNTPAAVGCGMTGICRGAHVGDAHLDVARAMFDAVGRTVVV